MIKNCTMVRQPIIIPDLAGVASVYFMKRGRWPPWCYGFIVKRKLAGWTAGSCWVGAFWQMAGCRVPASGSLRDSPSFSCPKRKRKGPAVPMRRPPAGAAAFCLSSYAAKSCEARCKKQRAALVPKLAGREKRPMVRVRNLAPLRCGHLTTAYSPAWGPVNKEWI